MKRIIIGLLMSVCFILTACESQKDNATDTNNNIELEAQELEEFSGGENCNH